MEHFKDKANTYGSIILIIWEPSMKALGKGMGSGNPAHKIISSILDSLSEIKSKGKESIFGIIDVYMKAVFSMILSTVFYI